MIGKVAEDSFKSKEYPFFLLLCAFIPDVTDSCQRYTLAYPTRERAWLNRVLRRTWINITRDIVFNVGMTMDTSWDIRRRNGGEKKFGEEVRLRLTIVHERTCISSDQAAMSNDHQVPKMKPGGAA